MPAAVPTAIVAAKTRKVRHVRVAKNTPMTRTATHAVCLVNAASTKSAADANTARALLANLNTYSAATSSATKSASTLSTSNHAPVIRYVAANRPTASMAARHEPVSRRVQAASRHIVTSVDSNDVIRSGGYPAPMNL